MPSLTCDICPTDAPSQARKLETDGPVIALRPWSRPLSRADVIHARKRNFMPLAGWSIFGPSVCQACLAATSTKIRRLDPEQAGRMVFVTGASDEQSERAPAASGQPVLRKPFDPKELRAFVERVLVVSGRRSDCRSSKMAARNVGEFRLTQPRRLALVRTRPRVVTLRKSGPGEVGVAIRPRPYSRRAVLASLKWTPLRRTI